MRTAVCHLMWALVGLCVSAYAESDVETDATRVFQLVGKSVVVVRDQNRQGSGVVVRARIVVTNCHVAETDTPTIEFEKKSIPGRVVYRNSTEDLCVCEVDTDLPAVLAMRSIEDVFTGETAYAVGAPLGLRESYTAGVISSTRYWNNKTRVIQTDAPITPGNSGGALLDKKGRLLGITTFSWIGDKSKDVQNINFAYPLDSLPEQFRPRMVKSTNKYSEEEWRSKRLKSNENGREYAIDWYAHSPFDQKSILFLARSNIDIKNFVLAEKLLAQSLRSNSRGRDQWYYYCYTLAAQHKLLEFDKCKETTTKIWPEFVSVMASWRAKEFIK